LAFTPARIPIPHDFVLTANSTGDCAVQSCLRRWGLAKSGVTIKNMGQAEIISTMSSNNADPGGLWAPNIHTLEEKAGLRVLCSGKEAGATVPSALIVPGEHAEQNPENVARFLAIYLRGWSWANAHKAEAIADQRAARAALVAVAARAPK
jgi:NitT/TauT family transport system substrate-binding protein